VRGHIVQGDVHRESQLSAMLQYVHFHAFGDIAQPYPFSY
jgi:hypothetical protein